MLNRVILIGRLTRDPELKRTATSGVALTSFTLAVDRNFQSSRGERETDFIRIICWDKLAERCKEYLSKGRLVAVEGRLQVRNWETPQGERRSIVEVRADDVRFLERASTRQKQEGEDPPADSYDDDYEGGGGGGNGGAAAPAQGGEPLFPENTGAARSGGRKDFGNVSDKTLDEEIDLDDDDPFKEEF